MSEKKPRVRKPRPKGDGYGTINFNGHDFRKAQGHMPRGVAFWVFYFADHPEDPWLPRRPDASWMPLTYTRAKDYATIEAKRRGVRSVRVDPYPL